MSSSERIKERKLVRWAIAYGAAAWAVLQLAQFLWDLYGWPPVILKLMPIALGIGFLAALVIAWFHGEKGQQRVTAVEISMLAAIAVLGGALLLAARRHLSNQNDGVAAVTGANSASVAVLPFENFSADKEQEYFSDGITEEILNVLAQIPGLQVAARTSSFAFKGKDVPIDEIAKRLHVGTVLEGSVRKAGDRLRITAQLINAANGFHIWSQTFERNAKDVFAVQDEIASDVASVLRVKLIRSPIAKRDVSPEAHDAFLLGLSKFNRRRTVEDLDSAISYFERATHLQPDYAQAYALEADVWSVYASYGSLSGTESLRKAKPLAEQALALDSTSAEAHAALGNYVSEMERDYVGADAHFKKAQQLNPSYATAWQWQAENNFARDPQLALRLLQRAVTMDPLSNVIHFNLAHALVHLGRLDDAKAEYTRVAAMEPDVGRAALNLIVIGCLQQDSVAVNDNVTRGMKTSHFDASFAMAGRACFHPELRAEASRRLSKARPVTRAIWGGLLRDRKFALDAFRMSVESHEGVEQRLPLHPALAWLRGDPQFKALVREMGLTPAH